MVALERDILPATTIRSSTPTERIPARVVLRDGATYCGWSFGALRSTAGEVVFNTGMVGYPESLTDPSYRGQILVLTYPLIGNYGVPTMDRWEAPTIHVRGLVVAERPEDDPQHWNATESLGTWLQRLDVPAVYGIDTRALTQHLRTRGVMLGKIDMLGDDVSWSDPHADDLIAQVSSGAPTMLGNGDVTIALLDCGAKRSIAEALVQGGARVVNLPYGHNPFTQGIEIDGIVVSNGPGDPVKAVDTIATIRSAMDLQVPIFGVCLGNQLLALAAGASTYKLKFGHRGQNQPVEELSSGKCFITSQNHGYAVDETSLPQGWEPWFRNLNDESNEGIRHRNGLWRSVQFHPEARPGPTDTRSLFDRFLQQVRAARRAGRDAVVSIRA